MDTKLETALAALTKPKSIAVVGASERKNSVGYGVLKGLVHGCVFESRACTPYPGNVYAVNPHAQTILGKRCYPRLQDIPGEVECAVVAVPSAIVPQILKDAAAKKVKAAIVISAGFAELGERGKKLQQEVAAIAKKAGIRLLGPNVLGILVPPNNYNASFALTTPEPGRIAFISQSGALADSVVDWALEAKYGFSLIASLGNAADLNESDFLEYCLQDPHTKAIAMYLESVHDGPRFLKVASRAAKSKPIIVLKGGKGERGGRAVASHTGSLAGSYAVYEAALRQAGVFLADSVEDLFDLARALSEQPRTKGKNVAIVTNGGGVGVVTADYCEQMGLDVVPLKESTLKKLDASKLMHPASSRANPLDLVGDALPQRYEMAANTLLAEPYVDGLIVIQTLQTMTDSKKDAEVVVKAQQRFPEKPVVAVFMGGKYSAPGVAVLRKHNIPDYNDPLKAVKVMKVLCGVV